VNFLTEFRMYVVLIPVTAAVFHREVVRWLVFSLST